MGRAKPHQTLLLAGMMGAGKSSVGRRLAQRLGWRFIDTDERIKAVRGLPLSSIFEQEGEAAFRRLERDVLEGLPTRKTVVALGGGAILSAENRAIAAAKGMLVWLDARPETLAERVGDGADRPLLANTRGDARVERLRAIARERETAYAHARRRVVTDGYTKDEVCTRVLEALGWEEGAA